MSDEVTPEAPEVEPELTLIPVPVYDDVPADPPRFYVQGDALHARVPDDDGTLQEHVISLRVKKRLIEEIEDLPTSLDQLQALVTIRGEDGIVDAIDEMDIIDAREVARKFFQAFHEKEEARLGESLRSSAS